MVAGGDGFADVGWEDPGGAADVEDLSVGSEEDGQDVGVACDFADSAGVDGAGEGRCCAARQGWLGWLLWLVWWGAGLVWLAGWCGW